MLYEMKWDELDKAVNVFAKGVVKQARGNLTREKANASKTLWRSIGYRWKNWVLDFVMETYGTFLDRGVSGTGKLWVSKTKYMPVAYNVSDSGYKFNRQKKSIGGSLKQWLRLRGVSLKAEFPIKRSIHAKGIRPRRFFTYAFDRQLDKFNDQVGRAINSDLNKHIDKILKQ